MLCPKTKKWIKKGKCAGDKFPLFFDVDGLEEGEEYNFRVSAINDEGVSDPLEGDKPIKAKNPFGEYRIASKVAIKVASLNFYQNIICIIGHVEMGSQ